MALSKVLAITAANTASGGALTTGTFDSSGYTHIIIFTKYEGGAAVTITPSDNKGTSSWNSETQVSHSGGEPHAQMHWAKIGTPGSGHTATMTPSTNRSFRALGVWLVNAGSGVLEKDAVAGAANTGLTADGGTLSTTGVSVVSFMGIAEYNTTSWTPSAGWSDTAPDGFDGIGGVVSTLGCSRGPETTTPIDPQATQGVNDRWAVASVSLREGAGGGGGSLRRKGSLALVGVGR